MDAFGALIVGLTGAIAGFIGGSIAGAVAGYYQGWKYKTDLDVIKKRVETLWGFENTQKGNDAKAAQAAQEAALMAEAATIFQAGGEDKMKKLAALAAQNPAIAMKLMRKFGVM